MTEKMNGIITKAAAGETLSSEEAKTLCENLPQEWEALARKNQELAGRLTLLESEKLPEAERLKRRFETEVASLKEQLARSESDRTAAHQELSALHFRRRTDRLAEECGFADPDYFEFLCRKNAFDPGQEERHAEFITRLKEKLPRFFKLDLHPGPAEGTPPPAAAPHRFTIEEMLTDAPSISE